MTTICTHRIILLFTGLAMLLGITLVPQQATQAQTTTNVTCNVATLKTAITNANVSSGDDILELTAKCTYTLTAIDNSAYGGNGLPAIVDTATAGTLTINGNGATISRDSGAPDFRIFFVASGGDLTLDYMTIKNGRASDVGGGIFNWGTLTVHNSTVSANFTPTSGGGIYNFTDGTAIISSSTIIDNNAGFSGGGVFNNSTMTISNSTFFGNNTSFLGGGISNNNTVMISSSTITGNDADFSGGGIYNFTDATATISNSIFANSSNDNCYETVTDNGFNISDDGSCGFGGVGIGDNVDPMINSLASNGGPTQTHRLRPISPAIDNGGVCSAAFDQRGFRRNGYCDIGAYEAVYIVITEQDLFNQLAAQIAAKPSGQIEFMLVDFATDVFVFTVRTVDGTIGTVRVTSADNGSGYAVLQISSIDISGSFATTVNQELMTILLDSLNTLIVQKTGVAMHNADTLTVEDTAITVEF
jgi:hypothetical protein